MFRVFYAAPEISFLVSFHLKSTHLNVRMQFTKVRLYPKKIETGFDKKKIDWMQQKKNSKNNTLRNAALIYKVNPCEAISTFRTLAFSSLISYDLFFLSLFSFVSV